MSILERLRALVHLGSIEVSGREFELTWLAAGSTDTVNVDSSTGRLGTVVRLDGDHPQLVVVDTEHLAWLAESGHEAAIVSAAASAYDERESADVDAGLEPWL